MLLLLDPPPVLFSPMVAYFQWAIITCLGFLTVWQFYNRKARAGLEEQIKRLNTALEAAESAQASMAVELDLTKTNLERSRHESTKKSEEIGRLQLATDLKPLFDALRTMAEAQQAYYTEGRERFSRAETDLARNHSEQSGAWKAVFEELKVQHEESIVSRKTSEEAYRTMNSAFAAHIIDDKNDQLERRQHDARFLSLMDSVERRFSDVGVRLGVVKWSTPESPPEFDDRFLVPSHPGGGKRRRAHGGE